MCGIAGIFNPENPKNEKIFPQMLDTLYPRGPDEEGIYVSPDVILGSRRLSILDLEGGRQPISSEDGSVLVILNGEIYNFKELREKLEKLGHRFKTKTDTEVIVHLYEEDKTNFITQLRGMFAFALYDKKEETLVLARDRVGKKPLFYTKVGKQLLFASEIKALLKHPNVSKQPNFQALYHYFSLKHIPRPLTAFAGIDSLLPGEIVTFKKNGETTRRRYWSLSFEPKKIPLEEALHQLKVKLNEAVALRVYSSDVPVGAFLSGGLDSSLVVALMRQYAGGELHTFSLAYEEEENPDIPYARQMAKLLNTTHHEYVLQTKKIPESLPNIVDAFDEPFGGVISTYFLSSLISKHVKVALSGDGADELFGSYANHRLAWPIHDYLTGNERWNAWGIPEVRLKQLAHSDPWVWRMRLYSFDDEYKRSFFSQNFLSHLNGTSTAALVRQDFIETSTLDPLNRMLEVDFNHLLPDEVLTYVDRLSMAQSLEIRSPFLDQEVVSFSASLPSEYKISPTGTKEILRKFAAQYVPKEIIERPKKGFVLPFHKWLLGSLGTYTRETLSPANLERSEIFNTKPLMTMFEQQEKGERDFTYGLFSLLMFQVWWKKHWA